MNKLSSNQIIGIVIALVLVVAVGVVAYGVGVERGSEQRSSTEDSQVVDGPATQESNEADESQQQVDNQPADTGNGDVPISEVEQTVLDRFGGTIEEIDSDDYRGAPAWEVEVKNSDQGDIEVMVDKRTGEILHWEANQ